MIPKNVIIKKDVLAQRIRDLQRTVKKEILVGIPSAEGARDDGPANNAMIGYVMEFGSPAQNIPARPFLIPGMKKAQPQAFAYLRKAVAGSVMGVDAALNAAGQIAVDWVKFEINSDIPPPLSPETIRNRHRQRGTASMRESEEVYLDLVSKGVEPGAAQSETGIRTLINTGSLRNAITYVIRDKR